VTRRRSNKRHPHNRLRLAHDALQPTPASTATSYTCSIQMAIVEIALYAKPRLGDEVVSLNHHSWTYRED
jgi:hypothetical protein